MTVQRVWAKRQSEVTGHRAFDSDEWHYRSLWSPYFVEGPAVIAGETAHWRIESLGLRNMPTLKAQSTYWVTKVNAIRMDNSD